MNKFNSLLKTLFITLSITAYNPIFSQKNCLTEHQLSKALKTDLADLSSFLKDNDWRLLETLEDATLYRNGIEMKASSIQWSNYHCNEKLTRYSFSSNEIIMKYEPCEKCFNSLFKELNENNSGETSNDDIGSLKTVFVSNNDIWFECIERGIRANEQGLALREVSVFNGISLPRLEQRIMRAAEERAALEAEQERIRREEEEARQNTILALVTESERLLQSGDPYGAVEELRAAQELDPTNDDIAGRLLAAERTAVAKRLRTLSDSAERYRRDRQFPEALALYENVLTLDPKDTRALEAVNELKELIDLLDRRDTHVFNYDELHRTEHRRMLNTLAGVQLEKYVASSTSTTLDFKLHVRFDTAGTDLTSVEVTKGSIPELRELLGAAKRASSLPTPRIRGYNVGAASTTSFRVSASTQHCTFNTPVQKNDVQHQCDCMGNEEATNALGRYLSGWPYPSFGIPTTTKLRVDVDITLKDLNGSTFTDIRMTDVRAKAGPENVWRSLVVPGWGKSSVKDQGGWFPGLLAIPLAATAWYYGQASDRVYATYLNETDPAKAIELYDEANLKHKISLVSFGLAGSIYLSDLIATLSIGSKNRKESASIRKKLKQGPVPLRLDPMVVTR
jgi:tetratricopeptide (TPR) repeat protein